MCSCVWLFATLWIVALQAPLSMRFSRQEYWSGLSFPSPGDLPNPGIKPVSPVCLLHFRQILYCWATREALILTRGTMLYSRFLKLTHLFNCNFISFEQQPLMLPLLSPSNHHCIGYFCMLGYFGPLLYTELCSVCPSVTDLFHVA